MNVRELIAILQQHDPEAEVVLTDPSAEPVGEGVMSLRAAEIRAVKLGSGDRNGVSWQALWRDDGSLEGPLSGVLLTD